MVDIIADYITPTLADIVSKLSLKILVKLVSNFSMLNASNVRAVVNLLRMQKSTNIMDVACICLAKMSTSPVAKENMNIRKNPTPVIRHTI